jgi:imidazolonepropionase-like amidohydrolase
MRIPIRPGLLGLLLMLASGAALAADDAPPAPVEFAFVDVTVLPMDRETTLGGQTVLIRGERIVAMGPDVAVPDTAERIDGSGKYLLPGLAEMHGHVPGPDQPDRYTENVLFLYVANGITTVRGMLGAPGQLALRERANSGELIAPTLYLAGPSFNGQSISSPKQAVAKVRKQKSQGWNLLKIHPGLSRTEYDALATTAAAVGMRFGGHVPADVGLLHALEQGQETFDHLDGYVEYLRGIDPQALNEEALADAVRRTREAGAWAVPTMALWEVLLGAIGLEQLQSYPELRYMPPDVVARWTARTKELLGRPDFDPAAARRLVDWRMRVLRALHEGGARILMGTDAPQLFSVPGFSLQREIERMVAAGMSNYAILQSGSSNVGEYFANEDRFGTVAVGQRADLLLLHANPLQDIRHLQDRAGVMVRGRWLREDAIQQRLAKIAATYREAATP